MFLLPAACLAPSFVLWILGCGCLAASWFAFSCVWLVALKCSFSFFVPHGQWGKSGCAFILLSKLRNLRIIVAKTPSAGDVYLSPLSRTDDASRRTVTCTDKVHAGLSSRPRGLNPQGGRGPNCSAVLDGGAVRRFGYVCVCVCVCVFFWFFVGRAQAKIQRAARRSVLCFSPGDVQSMCCMDQLSEKVADDGGRTLQILPPSWVATFSLELLAFHPTHLCNVPVEAYPESWLDPPKLS